MIFRLICDMVAFHINKHEKHNMNITTENKNSLFDEVCFDIEIGSFVKAANMLRGALLIVDNDTWLELNVDYPIAFRMALTKMGNSYD